MAEQDPSEILRNAAAESMRQGEDIRRPYESANPSRRQPPGFGKGAQDNQV